MKTVFKVGDKVYDVRYGFGIIEYISECNRVAKVKYGTYIESYTLDSKSVNTNLLHVLSFEKLDALVQEKTEVLPERGGVVWVKNHVFHKWTIGQFMFKSELGYRVTNADPFDSKNGCDFKFLTTTNPYSNETN